MENNLFQLLNENDVDEIMEDNQQTLIVAMFSSTTSTPCKQIKPIFVDLSKRYNDCIFLYIDINNFKNTNYKFTKNIEATPKFVFYIGSDQIAFITGAHEKQLVDNFTTLKLRIDAKRKEFQEKEIMLLEKQKQQEIQQQLQQQQQQQQQQQHQQPQQPQQPSPPQLNIDLMNKKIELLQKLFDLMQKGVKLSKQYNLESNYDEMITEYEYHMQQLYPPNNNSPSQVNSTVTPSSSVNPQVNQQMNQQVNQQVNPQVNQPVNQPVNQQVNQQVNQKQATEQEQILKKQEQLRQVQELNKMNQSMQMQQLMRIQQLKYLQKMKEQQEKREEETEKRKQKNA